MTCARHALRWTWLLTVVSCLVCIQAQVHPVLPSRATREDLAARNNDRRSAFVSVADGQFIADGKPFNFVGTDAYWLPMLNSTDNVNKTLQSIKDTNLTVVRLWAFNDVTEVPPDNGTYFQLLFPNGTAIVNNGTTGFERLDTVIDLAEKLGLKILLTTTNNWNPQNTFNASLSKRALHPRQNIVSNASTPRGFLSNDYGGMDLYVRQLIGMNGTHDEFYVNTTIKNIYKSYLKVLVSRYANHTGVFAWEIANDARCNSTLPANHTCNTLTVTDWHSEIAQHIQQFDKNHLIASGTQGFQCMQDLADCPKRFPPAPPPQVSPAPGTPIRKRRPPMTLKALRKIQADSRRSRPVDMDAKKRGGGKTVRGRWKSSAARRQAPMEMGSAFDGSFGVDSQDILGIPQISFSTFQLFPDQNTYLGQADPNIDEVQNAREAGINWIRAQAMAAQELNKPSLLTAFGLVANSSRTLFIPFNSTAPSPLAFLPPANGSLRSLTDDLQGSIYSDWLNTAVQSGVNGMIQYQWTQPNLTTTGGGGVVSSAPNAPPVTSSPNNDEVTSSPNDGYGVRQANDQAGSTGPGSIIGSVLQQAAQSQFARNSGISSPG